MRASLLHLYRTVPVGPRQLMMTCSEKTEADIVVSVLRSELDLIPCITTTEGGILGEWIGPGTGMVWQLWSVP